MAMDMPGPLCYMRALAAPPRHDQGEMADFDGRIAQLVEQLTLNQRVQGSSPCAPTIKINSLW